MSSMRCSVKKKIRKYVGGVIGLGVVLIAWGCGHESPFSSRQGVLNQASKVSPTPGVLIGAPVTHKVTIHPDGTFSPSIVTIRDGDRVQWSFHDPTDSVVPAQLGVGHPAICSRAKPYDSTDTNDFTGPLTRKASGVFALSPMGTGFQEVVGACATGHPSATVGISNLCETGGWQETMISTWQSRSIVGVYIRLDWSRVQTGFDPASGEYTYDWTVLDREVNRAVRNGKLYNLSFRAGNEGTPDWIFSTDQDGTLRAHGGGGVKRLAFRDGGSNLEPSKCGTPMYLGNPTSTTYQNHYFALLKAVAARLKSRADWYRALAYVKPSGANLFTHENRLPKRCKESCVCNTQVWATNGFTPDGLNLFYQNQLEVLRDNFPHKDFAYMLIQAGFPRVNNSGDYLQADGTSSGGELPGGIELTKNILNLGRTLFGDIFTVVHNGLTPIPPAGTCPNEGLHPAVGPYASSDSGCPNRWVLKAGADGQNTGFQTNNASRVRTPQDLDHTFQNLETNSDGVYLEIYEQRLWEGERTHVGGVLDPKSAAPRSIADWNQVLQGRRASMYPSLRDQRSMTLTHTFRRTPDMVGTHTIHYIHGSKCQSSGGFGVIQISP